MGDGGVTLKAALAINVLSSSSSSSSVLLSQQMGWESIENPWRANPYSTNPYSNGRRRQLLWKQIYQAPQSVGANILGWWQWRLLLLLSREETENNPSAWAAVLPTSVTTLASTLSAAFLQTLWPIFKLKIFAKNHESLFSHLDSEIHKYNDYEIAPHSP